MADVVPMTAPPLRAEWVLVELRRVPRFKRRGFVEHKEVLIIPHHPCIGSPQRCRGGAGGARLGPVERVIMWRERELR
jgi:hypothetical protein